MSEANRRTEPNAAELADPLLKKCRQTADAFREARRIREYPDKWERFRARNAAMSKAERAGRSLRAIGRAVGMTHAGVRNVLEAHRDDGYK